MIRFERNNAYRKGRNAVNERARLFAVDGIAMLGNPQTGFVIGLSPDEVSLAQAFVAGEASIAEVGRLAPDLAAQMEAGRFDRLALPVLKSAYLHITHRCNLRCEGCYSWIDDRNDADDPTVTQIGNALRYLSSRGIAELNISGGEPFLRSDLPAILELAAIDHGIPSINVLTNGTVLDRGLLSACAPYIDTISVSFDGATADHPAFIRGEQRFDQLVEFVTEAQAADINVCITPTVHRLNIDDVPLYYDLAARLHCELNFSLLSSTSCGWGDEGLMPTDDDLRRLASIMIQRSGGDGAAIQTLASGLECRENCGAGMGTLSVAADGEVYPCHMMHDERYDMGNVFDGQGPTAKECELIARRVHEVSASSSCASCDLRYLCGNGCRARAIGSGGETDPYCTLYQVFFRETLESIKRQLPKEANHAVSF